MALIATALASAGLAQTEQLDVCRGKDKPTLDTRIGACTVIIQSGWGSAKERAEIFHIRGTQYFYRADYDRAINDYNQAIKLDPGNSELFDNRCWTRATINELQGALADCKESLRLRPNVAAALDTLGFVYLKLGQFDQAIATYDAALKIDPKSAYSLYGRGMAKLKIGDKTGGNADVAAAKAIKDVAAEMAGYGVK